MKSKKGLAKVFLFIALAEMIVSNMIAIAFQIDTFNTWYSIISLWFFYGFLSIAGILYSKEIKKSKEVLCYIIRFAILAANLALLGTTIKMLTKGILN